MRWVWPLVCAVWVATPILGWWSGASARNAQVGWWVLVSVVVCVVGMVQQPRRETRFWAWTLAWCVVVVASHLLAGPGWGVAWLYQATLILLASWFVHERGEWRWLHKTVLVLGLFQGGVVLWQLSGWTAPWPSAGSGLSGTLSQRAALSIFWGACSMLSQGKPAWGFALLACLTGSLSGSVPAVARLLWTSRTIPVTLPLGLLGLLALSHRVWGPRLLGRWQAMESLEFLQRGWLTGWGFLPFPGGWRYTDARGHQAGLVAQLDYHNAFIDWIARTGLIGGVGLLVLVWWVSTRLTTPWRRWTAFLASWAGMWQSAEAFPVMTMLCLVWLIALASNQETTC